MSRALVCWLIVAWFSAQSVSGQESDSLYRVGFLEGGDYISHSLFRDAFRRYLDQVTPEGREIKFEPTAFKSANWDRRECGLHAVELKENRLIDMVVAIGPWAVESLREAGFNRPVLAVRQFDPISQGLINAQGRPITNNLSIIAGRFDLISDFSSLRHLMPVRKLGLIVFPSNKDELPRITERFEMAAGQLGITIVTAEGYNNTGTFAFFKALQSLDKSVDAVYISPLWGLDPQRIRQFMAATTNRRLPVISSEGRQLVERGALFYPGNITIEQTARIAAEHVVRIMRGKQPDELPVFFSMIGGSIVNLGAAKVTGISVPDDILFGADVIKEPLSDELDILYLPEAVSLASARNQGIQAIGEKIEAAAAAASSAASAYLPQLTADASAGYIDDNAVANSGGRFDNFRFTGSVHLSQALLSLSKIRDKRLSRESVESERIRKRETLLDLEYVVNLAYLDLLEAGDQLEVYRAYRRDIDKSLELSIARELFERGQDIERLKWRQERLTATDEIVKASARVDAALVMLNGLLSQPGHQQLRLDNISFAEQGTIDRISILRRKLTDNRNRRAAESFLVRLAFDLHPSLKANEQFQKLQRLRLSRHSADYMPEIGFRASFDIVDSLASRPNFDEEHVTWSVGATVSLPLFLGGRRAHEGRRLTADLSALEYERDNRRITLMAEVRLAASEFFAWSFRIPPIGEAAQISAQYHELVLPDYESGSLSVNDIIQAAREARDLKLQSNASRYAFFGSAARLSHTIGIASEASGVVPIDEILGRLDAFSGDR